MKLVFRTSIFVISGILGGCSWFTGEDSLFESSEYDYTNAKVTTELKVPETVGELNVQDHFMVPELGGDSKGVVYGVEADVVAPMQVLSLGTNVRVNRDSSFSSAFITKSEIQAWDSVVRFLEREQIPIDGKDIKNGSIDTGWQVKNDDAFWSGDITAWRYRYSISITPADRATEVILTVELKQAQELVDDTGEWRSFAETGRTQTEFLNSILGFLYVEEIQESRQLVNQSAIGGISVTLGSDKDGNPALITSADMEHVWTRIPVAFKLLDISIEDQDRSKGLYFVKINDTEGFFDSLAFWSDNDDRLNLPKQYYRLQVLAQGERVSISFFDNKNEPIKAAELAENFPVLSKAFRSRTSD